MLHLVNNIPPFVSSDRDVVLSSYSGVGNLDWSVTIGGIYQDFPSDLIVSGSKIFAVTTHQPTANTNDYGFHLYCFDTLGTFLWEQQYSGSGYDVAYSITTTSDSCYLLTGKTFIPPSPSNFGNYDIVVKKVDSLGNLLWSTNIGFDEDEGRAYSEQLSDGSILVTGYIDYSVPPYERGMLAKLDLDGNAYQMHQKSYGNNTMFNKSIENDDGSITVLGFRKNTSNNYENIVVNYTPFFDTIWFKNYYVPSGQEALYDLIPTSDDGYLLVGSAFDSLQNTWLVKTNCVGEEDVLYPLQFTGLCFNYDCSQIQLPSEFYFSDSIVYLSQGGQVTFNNFALNLSAKTWLFGDGNMVNSGNVVTHAYSTTGVYQVSLIVHHGLCSDTITQMIYVYDSPASLEEIHQNQFFEIFPNPSHNNFTIKFSENYIGELVCYNLFGQEIFRKEIRNSDNLQISNLKAGIYVVKGQNQDGLIQIKKVRIY